MAEKEYIEREASCRDCIHAGVCYMQEVCNDIGQQLKEFGCDNFKSTADVVEVVHGEWIKETRPKKSEDGLYYWNALPRVVYVCSVCGREELQEEPYCNCGAKMDGKGDTK